MLRQLQLRIYNKYITAMLVVVALVCSLAIAPLVNATSDYDNLVLSGGEPIVSHAACGINENLGGNYGSYLTDVSKWSTYASSNFTAFNSALATAQTNGAGWALAQNKVKSIGMSSGDSATFTTDDSMLRFFVTPGDPDAEFTTNGSFDKHLSPQSNTWMVTIAVTGGCAVKVTQASNSAAGDSSVQVLAWESTNSSWYAGLYALLPVSINYNVEYPTGYEGEEASSSDDDIDGDGLTGGSEAIQGTSDTKKDTDGDGLNDYIESEWYTGRIAAFCDDSSCTNHTYPDPLVKDVYVEIDWMKESGSSGRSYKPSTAQLSLVRDAYTAQGINAHFDTGQYGGGNELPNYIQNLHFEKDPSNFDFYDYKNGTSTTSANFDSSRYHIWHYMITGYEYAEITGSSGVSYFSDDDTFISSGLIEDNPGNDFTYSNIDYAIAGTILHELGHNLCLNDKTTTLRSECYSSYIDANSAPSTYNSVMNYSYQMSNLLDYSDGANGSGDHDDWSAINLGLADFANTNQGDQTTAGKGGLRVGVSRSQAKQLRKEHRIFSRVDKSKRSFERQVFDARRILELNNR